MLRLAVMLTLLVCSLSYAAEPDAKKVEFFENKIRPVLVEHCYRCHSEDAQAKKKLRGGILVDSQAGLLKGGDSGPAVVPGKAAEGTLLESLKYDGDIQMPPAGKLPDAVIADFEKWLADGAVDPRTNAVVKVSGIDFVQGREFWSLQTPKEPKLPSSHATKTPIHNPIDQFIQAKWQEKQLQPTPLADKHVLLRRAYLGLTGLPPTPEVVTAFLADTSPKAFEKVVLQLLASPQYGEKWARHWLDVARYAEDQAHTFGVQKKNQAWRYRDWVVQALNADIPYDQFVKLQIAGDMLPDEDTPKFDPNARFAKLGGLGFLGLGAEYYKNTAREQAIAEELDDRVDTLTRGFLGITVACARCHDHKFDPIAQTDYYALAGIYMGTNLGSATIAEDELVAKYQAAQKRVRDAEGVFKKAQAEAKKDAKDEKLKKIVEMAKAEVERMKKEVPPAPAAVHVVNGNGSGMKLYIRGNPATKADDVPKGFPQVLPCSTEAGQNFNRLTLANAIATADNPLTARVIVNRVWAWHFGRGIVNTPDNFGKLGDRPSHPELLDWLTVNFIKNGWSLKWLHQQIVLSSTYQLSSEPNPKNDKIDEANIFLWKANRRRLNIEQWRDSLLAVSGRLDPSLGGPTFNLDDANSTRRTLYAKISRHDLDGLLRLFDFPDANVTAAKRSVTTVPQQQLFALNSPFMETQAKAFAERLEKLGQSDAEKITAGYQLAFGREPSSQETRLAEQFLRLPLQPEDKMNRWQQLAQVLLASNELMYLD